VSCAMLRSGSALAQLNLATREGTKDIGNTIFNFYSDSTTNEQKFVLFLRLCWRVEVVGIHRELHEWGT